MTIHETDVITHLAFEVWDQRVNGWRSLAANATSVRTRRGGKRRGAVNRMDVGTATVTLRGAIDLARDVAYRPNTRLRIVERSTSKPIFTGAIEDARQAYVVRGDKRELVTTVTAVDGVQSLANTPRYGAVTDNGLGFEPWRSRIMRLLPTARIAFTAPSLNGVPRPASFVKGGPLRPTGWFGTWSIQSDRAEIELFRGGSASSIPAGSGFYSLTLSDLTIGQVYTVRASVRAQGGQGSVSGIGTALLRVVGRAATAAFAMNGAQPAPSPLLEFTATAKTHTLVFENPTAIGVSVGGSVRFTLTTLELSEAEGASDYQLRDIALESSLATHFDVACDTVGAAWWVDAANVLQFRRGLRDVEYTATLDETTIVGAEPEFDTRATVNVLNVDNAGRAIDAQGEWRASTTTTSHVDEPSVARWGARSESLEISMHVGAGYERDVERRVSAIFSRAARPRYCVPRVRLNAQQNPATTAALDVYSRVSLTVDGFEQRARVMAIAHEITARRWMTTLEFTDMSVGTTFAEYNSARGAQTFAQWNAANAGKTFLTVNGELA